MNTDEHGFPGLKAHHVIARATARVSSTKRKQALNGRHKINAEMRSIERFAAFWM
jgi:hypothetical protein